MVAALQEKVEKMNVLVQDQENRMVKLEHQSGVSIEEMKKGKSDLFRLILELCANRY